MLFLAGSGGEENKNTYEVFQKYAARKVEDSK
jgi:hypothetical protein